MPKIRYRGVDFKPDSLAIIEQANEIIEAYQAQGYNLTLRQLYYQFVARDLLPNKVQSYKRLGSIVNDARLSGLIDWEAIEDRTRETVIPSTWGTPGDIVEACASQFRIDKWEDQEYRPEVWIEKEALAGVIERICHELQVPHLSCRGYTSQSEMWASAQRMRRTIKQDQKPFVIHLGDHDPSGIDMSRDIQDRLGMFAGFGQIGFERIALNMDQVQQYNPPPNPAKTTDARFESYMREYGDESWELDALEPQVLTDLIRDKVTELRDDDLWEEKVDAEQEHRRKLSVVSERWDELTEEL